MLSYKTPHSSRKKTNFPVVVPFERLGSLSAWYVDNFGPDYLHFLKKLSSISNFLWYVKRKIYIYSVQSGIRVSLLIVLVQSDSRCVKTEKWIKFVNSNLLRTKNIMMKTENDFNPDHTYQNKWYYACGYNKSWSTNAKFWKALSWFTISINNF